MTREADRDAEPLGTLLGLPHVRYPQSYLWFVLVSALDIMLTWTILSAGGSEVNPIADLVIRHWGLIGAIVFKFSLTVFVIIICEVVGRERDLVGRGLAVLAVAMSAIPVVFSLYLLAIHTWFPISGG